MKELTFEHADCFSTSIFMSISGSEFIADSWIKERLKKWTLMNRKGVPLSLLFDIFHLIRPFQTAFLHRDRYECNS